MSKSSSAKTLVLDTLGAPKKQKTLESLSVFQTQEATIVNGRVCRYAPLGFVVPTGQKRETSVWEWGGHQEGTLWWRRVSGDMENQVEEG